MFSSAGRQKNREPFQALCDVTVQAMLFQAIGKNVLVVDDNRDSLRSMKVLLELIGVNVRTIEDGEEAVEEIKRHRYDLLIFDVSMPRIDGVDLFQIVKNSEEQKNIPVLFTSGLPSWSEPEERRREIFNRAEGFLQKPFNTAVFLDTIRNLLENRSPVE